MVATECYRFQTHGIAKMTRQGSGVGIRGKSCSADIAPTSTRIALPGVCCHIRPMNRAESIFDQVDEERLSRAIAVAQADVAAGRVVPHAVVAEWLMKLADAYEKDLPPPPPPRSGVAR